MKTCDTCGGAVGPHHPFAVCPKCLFKEALHAPSADRSGSPSEPTEPVAFYQIPKRRDFFDKYELVERLQGGGQGEVFRAWDFDLRRYVAMKRLAVAFLDSQAAIYRFLAEAQIASQLEHPGILPIHDVGRDPDGRPFFTTPVLPGTTFADVFERVRDPQQPEWSLERVLGLLGRVCEIVSYAHSRGVIHRDLKPANILVGKFGDIRVIDWGSAHVLREARAAFEEAFVRIGDATIETDRARAMAGALDSPLSTFHAGQPITLLFSPPEILRGELGLLGPRIDIYAMGVMLYEVASGRHPYANPDNSLPPPPELRQLILNGPPERLRMVNSSVSRDLASICEKAMAHEAADRYASMQEVAEDLRAFLEIRPVKARHPTPVVRLQKWARRNSHYVAFGCLAFALVAASASVAFRLKAQKDQARQVTALREASLAARSGQWQNVLQRLAQAESAGYRDQIDLGLQRVEAWDCLGQPSLARGELDNLIKRSDLGQSKGVVLLRAGEYELFGKTTFQEGVAHVRAALALGLDPADKAFAQGLLADSTPEALALFRQALHLNPYHRSAHRLSLGLALMLGQQAELVSHLRVFKVLFPDDPSPVAVEATGLALQGKLEEAEKLWASRPDTSGMQGSALLLAGFRLFSSLANYIDLDVGLGDRKVPAPKIDAILGSAMSFLWSGPASATTNLVSDVRFPQIPCVKTGLEEVVQLLKSLIFSMGADPNASVQWVKDAGKHLPEAVIPLIVASVQVPHRPAEPDKLRAFLTTQAELYEMAALLPSMLPKTQRVARFLAIRTYAELLQFSEAPIPETRHACVADIQRSLGDEHLSATECREYFQIALRLYEFDLAREILAQWERHAPGQRELLEARVRLDIVTGAFANALSLLDRMLGENPADAWALAQRQSAVESLQKLARENPASSGDKE